MLDHLDDLIDDHAATDDDLPPAVARFLDTLGMAEADQRGAEATTFRTINTFDPEF